MRQAVPKKQYHVPMTEQQEIGWAMDEMFDVHKPKYGHNRVGCAERA